MGTGLTRYRPQEPLAAGQVAPSHARQCSQPSFQFFGACGRQGKYVAVQDRLDGPLLTAFMRPVRSTPALCLLPLRAHAGNHWARVGDEGLHVSSGRYLSGLI